MTITLENAVNMWMVGRSKTTAEAYHYYLKDLDSMARGTLKKALLEVDDVELVQLFGVWGQTLKPSTMHTRTFMIRSFFAYALKKGWVEKNPAKDLRPPKFESTLSQRILSHEQVQTLIDSADCTRDRLIIRSLYYGALRVSELCYLRKRDIQQKGENWTLQVWGKGQRTEYVRIPDELGQALAAWSSTKKAEDFLFTALSGGITKITRTGVLQVIRRTALRAGLPKVTPHWLRHAHATVALSRGASIHLVQKSLRHRSIETTLIYDHLNPTDSSSLILPGLD